MARLLTAYDAASDARHGRGRSGLRGEDAIAAAILRAREAGVSQDRIDAIIARNRDSKRAAALILAAERKPVSLVDSPARCVATAIQKGRRCYHLVPKAWRDLGIRRCRRHGGPMLYRQALTRQAQGG